MTSTTADPFRLVNGACQVIENLARHLYSITRRNAAHTWVGRGYDPGSQEHGTRRALDYIISAEAGDVPTPLQRAHGYQIANWLMIRAKKLHIRHLIWDGKIWKTRYASQGWQPLSNRQGVSDWHLDHIHIYLQDTDGQVPNDPLVQGAPAPKPTPPPSAGAGNGPKPGPTARPFNIGNVLAAITAGDYDGNVTTIQAMLNKHFQEHGQGRLKVDGYYGAATKRVYAAWQRLLGYHGADADGIPGTSSLARLLGPAYTIV